ncbi:uncharacterized protein LOC126714708 isoform X2 [Quercus robur]|uniref:uncharacterized protein LOC126714708 isoform X2 n=1 Tax=Quercus robur TaxID=38942 RepID=UPI002162636A|nr:uncharacterized protein LOC126714708 isoform X2 [Quercus robur]
MRFSNSKWVSLCFCLLLSLQIIQGYKESETARTLKLEQGNAAHEVHCSRERSRAAQKIIEEYLMPFVEKEQYQMSRRCRLHSDNDLYRDQEQHKIRVDVNEWKCGYCRKRFYEEKHLDQHFDNRHYDLLNVSLADSCFPVNEGPSASRLHEFFLRQFCDAHTCNGGQKPFSRGHRKTRNVFYLIVSILTLMLLLLFYIFIYMHRRGMKGKTVQLKRISKSVQKKKPS